MSCNFREWLLEATVKGSAAGEAMKRTLDFKVDAEWIEWNLEPKGWITDRGVKDSFDLAAAFYNPKVEKPAFFYLRANAILERPDVEYDSKLGSEEMVIKATMFVLSGKTGLGGFHDAKTIRQLLEKNGHAMLAQRDNRIMFPSSLGELDGPVLRTPLELADWVNKVIAHTDIEGDDDNQDWVDPEVPDPSGRRLVGV